MEILFYPYDFKYKLQNGKVFVLLFSVLNDGTKVVVQHQHQPFFYAETKEDQSDKYDEEFIGFIQQLKVEASPESAKIVSWEKVEKDLLGEKKSFWKFSTNYPKAVPLLASELQKRGITCYERDILFVQRYLRDVGITPMTLVKAEGEFKSEGKYRVPLFDATNVKQISKEPKLDWEIMAVDIETYAKNKEIDFKKNPILMIAFYGTKKDLETGETQIWRKVITWKKFDNKLDYVEFVKDEVSLLERFREILLTKKPDILTGYYSDGFDLPYIKARADKYKIKLDVGLDYGEINLRRKEALIPGILHIDILKFIKYIFGRNLKTDSYSLDAVSQELLGNKKHKVNLDDLAHIWDHEPEKLHDFCEYNLHDAHLTSKLCSTLLPDIIEFTKIVKVPCYDVIRMRFSKLVESYILKRAAGQNVLAPNKAVGAELEHRMQERIQGAFVYEPKPGLYSDVVVFDFRSLYPTIITAHNVGPEGLNCKCCGKEKQRKVPELDNTWFCEKKKFIPSVLERLILRRASIKRLIKQAKEKGEKTQLLEARSYALKILGNSFYGYLGFYGARWYCLECAAATTAYARDYIKRTISDAEKKGFTVIYADTDSCFLQLGEKILDEAMEFMNEINFDLPGHMELEYEGFFPKALFVAVKGSEKSLGKGAKKKYALLQEDGELKITGFETVRRNWSKLAKEVQEKVLRLVLQEKNEEAMIYVKEIIDKLKNGKISKNKLILKTQITRELDKYSSVSPHVFVAKRMEAKGRKISPGMIISYIITKGSGIVRERAFPPNEAKEYDADYYIHHQILPAVSSILAVLGVSEDEILGKGKQMGLSGFM